MSEESQPSAGAGMKGTKIYKNPNPNLADYLSLFLMKTISLIDIDIGMSEPQTRLSPIK